MGRFEVRPGSRPPVVLPGRKAQALLAYLALPAGRAHSRDKLTGLFWPEADDARARHSLRQSVLEIRKRLGGAPGLVTADDAIVLEPASVDVDVVHFERLAAAPSPEALDRAAALYVGDLLEGFHVISPLFEEWLVAERERLRQTAMSALTRLLALQVDGPAEPAIRTAMRLLALDPLQEPVHRMLMRLYDRQGRRAAALRQYQICAATLHKELGVGPDEETERLHRAQLQEQRGRPPAEVRPRAARRRRAGGGPTLGTVRIPVVGREPEVARLRRALDDAGRGRGRAVLVEGEAGIGKSRLVLELAADAVRGGRRVLLGRCHESEQILPFGPWVDALRPAIESDEPLVRSLPAAVRIELRHLFPALETPGDPALPSSRDYRPLFEALAVLVDLLASSQPVVLILEDVQWADDLSLRLLPVLARRLAARPVLLVATVRAEDPAGPAGLRLLIDELARDPERLDRLTLGPLPRVRSLELFRTLLPAGAVDVEAAGERVWEVSEGNPFVIVEMARAVETAGVTALGGAGLPTRVRDLVAARLERLGERAQRLLAAAAAETREASLDLLRRAAELGEAEAVEAVDELIRQRILVGAGDRFALVHVLVREVAYDRLLPVRRRVLHRRLAEAIETLEAERLDDVSDRLAHHYSQAGDAPKAIAYLARLARSAMRRHAFEDAVRALQTGITLAAGLAGGERDRSVLDLSLQLAFALSVLGRFREILTLLLPEQARLDALGAPPQLSGPYHSRLALTYSYLGEQRSAARHAEQALDAARPIGDASTAGRAHYTLAVSCHGLGDIQAGVGHAEAAVAALETTDERLWLGLAHWVLGLNQAVLGDYEAALRAEALVESIGTEIGDARLRSLGASTRGWVHILRGDTERALAACTEAAEVARDPVSAAVALRRLGLAYLERGDAEAAVSKLAEWLRVMNGLGVRLGLSHGLAHLGEAHLLAGDLDRARVVAAESLQAADDDAFGRGSARRALGLVARAEGRLADADAELADAREIFEQIGARREVARTRLAQAEIARASGRETAALEHLTESRRLFEDLGLARYAALADRMIREDGGGPDRPR